MKVMSGRQIERFFRTNPTLAQDYAGDGFWERRAIAARLRQEADGRAQDVVRAPHVGDPVADRLAGLADP